MDMLCFRNLQFKALFYAAVRRCKKPHGRPAAKAAHPALVC
jgi:hypothetical protein